MKKWMWISRSRNRLSLAMSLIKWNNYSRPNITYDGKDILIFEPYSKLRGREAGGCINGMLQYLSIKYDITGVINNDTGVQ